MNEEIKHNNAVSVYKDFSNHAERTLAIAGGFDSLINQCFNENNARRFKTNLNIAIATAINTQGESVSECLGTPLLRAKVCNSIVKIIQLGAIIDYQYIYFIKFGGKNPDAGFNLQYQGEMKILEQNGYTNIQTGFVLKDEQFSVKTTMDRTEILHEPNYQKRLTEAKEIMCDVICGYAIYAQKGIRTAFIVDKDILETSHKMSLERSGKTGKPNLKWGFKKAIDISIVHALFRHLVLKDWDSEEFDYQNDDRMSGVSQHFNVKTASVKSINDIMADYDKPASDSVPGDTPDAAVEAASNLAPEQADLIL